MMKNLKAIGRELEDKDGDSGRERRFERVSISDGVVSRGRRKRSVLQVERKQSGWEDPGAFGKRRK